MSGRRPLIKGYFVALRLIVVRSMSAAVAPELRYNCLAAHNCKGDARYSIGEGGGNKLERLGLHELLHPA